MKRLMAWCVLDRAIWDPYRDSLAVFYERMWASLPIWMRRDYLAIYGLAQSRLVR